ncbi:hypothetical protein [Psychrobacter sanguinis]|uniref:hypothetical protein n=1 Tax=Psychrobacter sanguinis TaxID=861445 RepID=UPI001919EE26|nr:hypothetical protein [Psychrobacter sanguinis]MCC3344529.1 hypothetical protein [Psychrobacter sanguinis]
MTLKIENKLVTDGQALSTRIITLRNQSAIPAFVFRRKVFTVSDTDYERSDVSWAGLGVISDSDEHSIEYEPLGYAMVVLLDALGGGMSDNGIFIAPEQFSSLVLIEPYDIDLESEDRIKMRPDWTPKKGDLFCFLLNNHKEYHECVGVVGNSLLITHGHRYMLNQRFDMDYLDAFNEDDIEDIEIPYR